MESNRARCLRAIWHYARRRSSLLERSHAPTWREMASLCQFLSKKSSSSLLRGLLFTCLYYISRLPSPFRRLKLLLHPILEFVLHEQALLGRSDLSSPRRASKSLERPHNSWCCAARTWPHGHVSPPHAPRCASWGRWSTRRWASSCFRACEALPGDLKHPRTLS